MTFRDVAVKNFISHIRRYLSYFFCSCFTIVIFFIYITLYFNVDFMAYVANIEFKFLVYMGILGISVFSVYFISYAHSAFIKSRSSEFALFMTLGLTKKNLSRMIWVENLIILIFSLLGGVLSGALFSKLFFLVIRKLLGNIKLEYHLDYKSFAVTAAAFIVIYFIAILYSRKVIMKLSIVELLKKKKECPKGKGNVWAGVAGILVFLGAFVFALIAAPWDFMEKSHMYLIYTVAVFASMYLIITHFGALFFHYIRNKKNRYYKNILSFSEMEYSFTQNRKILFILSLIAAMTIYSVAAPFSLFSTMKYFAEDTRIGDIQYATIGSVNRIDESILQQILHQGDTGFLGEIKQEFLVVSYTKEGDGNRKPIISESHYRELNGDALPVEQGELLQIITTWLPGYTELESRKVVSLYSNGKGTDYMVSGAVHGKGINVEYFPSKETIVLDDTDYDRLKASMDMESIGIASIFTFEDWEKTDSILLGLKENMEGTSEDFPVDSVLEGYRTMKKIFSVVIFFFSFMGILFFASSGSIIFFKQYADKRTLQGGLS